MANFLAQKNIVLGITGSIAAYKSADLARRLCEAGANVRVVMTANAKRFITPLTLQAVSGFPIHDDLFDLQAEAAMGHIELARWADLILVAPASASFLARLAHGLADDLLTTLCLATKAPIAVAPAMNQGMWQHILTQENQQSLLHHGIHIIGPATGDQACGDVGPGRMMEPREMLPKINALFASDLLAGQTVLITAGPTHEAIDPIRFITNGSSGKMGYALAEAAIQTGAKVILISGPVHLIPPVKVETIAVVTALQMEQAVMHHIAAADIFISVAAVGDYRCRTIATQKIHKKTATLELQLDRNPDIVANVAALAKKPFIVGFAAETENLLTQAKAKMLAKKMDMIIANQAEGMGSDDNAVTVLTSESAVSLPRMQKTQLAKKLIDLIAAQYKESS